MSLTAPFQILTPEEHDALGLERVPNWTARNPLYKWPTPCTGCEGRHFCIIEPLAKGTVKDHYVVLKRCVPCGPRHAGSESHGCTITTGPDGRKQYLYIKPGRFKLVQMSEKAVKDIKIQNDTQRRKRHAELEQITSDYNTPSAKRSRKDHADYERHPPTPSSSSWRSHAWADPELGRKDDRYRFNRERRDRRDYHPWDPDRPRRLSEREFESERRHSSSRASPGRWSAEYYSGDGGPWLAHELCDPRADLSRRESKAPSPRRRPPSVSSARPAKGDIRSEMEKPVPSPTPYDTTGASLASPLEVEALLQEVQDNLNSVASKLSTPKAPKTNGVETSQTKSSAPVSASAQYKKPQTVIASKAPSDQGKSNTKRIDDLQYEVWHRDRSIDRLEDENQRLQAALTAMYRLVETKDRLLAMYRKQIERQG